MSKISTEFTALVSGLQDILEYYRNLSGSSSFNLQKNAEPFCKQVDEKMVRFDGIVEASVSKEQRPLYCACFQARLLNFLLASPVNARAYSKPRGYAGDYETIRLMHEDSFLGSTAFAKLMNHYAVSISAANTVRKRTEYLANRIRIIVEQSPNPVDILSVACGPALEISNLLTQAPHLAEKISLTLLDQEVEALNFSKNNLQKHLDNIRLIHSGIEGFLRQSAESKKYDIIYAFGLFDYFNRGVARYVIRHMLPMLSEGGRILISNASLDGLSYRTYAEFGLEWFLIYRNLHELNDLVSHMNCSHDIQEIGDGFMKFLEITR